MFTTFIRICLLFIMHILILSTFNANTTSLTSTSIIFITITIVTLVHAVLVIWQVLAYGLGSGFRV